MSPSQLSALLENITGHLKPLKKSQEASLQTARQKIAASLLQSDDPGSTLLFGDSELYTRAKIDTRVLKNISDIADKTVQDGKDEGLRAFVRDVAVSTPFVQNAMPDWALGARAAETYGPFAGADGRNIWIDIFKTVKLTAIYYGGDPIILFKTPSIKIPVIPKSPFPTRTITAHQYTVAAGAVWIKASLLTPDAPANTYVGLTAKSGTIVLSKAPTTSPGKTTMQQASDIDISIVPDAKEADIASGSIYGKDGLNSKFIPPKNFRMTWSGTTKKLTRIMLGEASQQAFGTTMQLQQRTTLAPDKTVSYNASLNAVAFEMQHSPGDFSIKKCEGGFIKFYGNAPVNKGYWALPAATIDVVNPLETEGNGLIFFDCGKGLSMDWTNLQNEQISLRHPLVICLSKNVAILDQTASAAGAWHMFDLWKDAKRTYSSSVKIHFSRSFQIIAVISGKEGTETLMTSAANTFHIDRPVKVNGEAFDISADPARTTSLLTLSASPSLLSVTLINYPPSNTGSIAAVPAKPGAIALRNALFTVAPGYSMLFGESNEAWNKIIRANLYIVFKLLRYVPTLPDPYVGKLTDMKRLEYAFYSNLISAVSYLPDTADGDKIDTNFYFGTVPSDVSKLPEPEPPVKEKEPVAPKREIRVSQTVREKVVLPKAVAKNTETKMTSVASSLRQSAILNRSVTINASYLRERGAIYRDLFKDRTPDSTKPLPRPSSGGPEVNIGSGEMNWPSELRGAGNMYEKVWDNYVEESYRSGEYFALLDVSSNANQLGVSIGNSDLIAIKTGDIRKQEDDSLTVAANNAPFIVQGMEVMMPGKLIRSFTLPQVAWEPEISNAESILPMDPNPGLLLYASDGGPTRIWNNSESYVALSPVPVVDSIISDFKKNPSNYTLSAFTLPFGLKAISYISRNFVETVKPDIQNVRPVFRRDKQGDPQLEGGIQISLKAGNYTVKPNFPNPAERDSTMFPGYIVQLNNLVDMSGNPSGKSNLGHRVTEIFNNEFLFQPLNKAVKLLKDSRGVPLSRMDITGYGANIFSNWLSPTAALAQTSQARFDVMHGRTSHEVIQVKSILYPWGIRVVRTITVFRQVSGFVYRTDSGWKAESDGRFDFSYRYLREGADANNPTESDFITDESPYTFHPGIIKGLFNIRNIKDAPDITEYIAQNNIAPNTPHYLDGLKGQKFATSGPSAIVEDIKCGAVYFDADVEIENVVRGYTGTPEKAGAATYGRVTSKKILGYVQVSPAGKPLTENQLTALLHLQNGSIGGEIDCIININNSNQQMRLTRFDVNNSVEEDNSPVFAVAARGSVLLPKAGSWSVVQHNAGTGEVSPLPEGTSIPLIRMGKWNKDTVIDTVNTVKKSLLRIAHPLDLIRKASEETINFGFLQSTGTQKALFLTPAYGNEIKKLLSKTPPVFADAYRLMEGSSIFPNIGNAIDNFGKAAPLLNAVTDAGQKVEAFVKNGLKDGADQVYELLEVEVKKAGEAVIDQGMALLKKGANEALDKALKFDLPSFDIPLVDTEALKIYIEYKTGKKDKNNPKNYVADKDGKLDFDVESLAEDAAKTWKSRLNNLAMVVDLGDMKRLMIIKGNFDAAKGKESGFEGGENSGNNGLPVPEIEFSNELQPVIDILEVLSQLSQGNYGEVMKKGLKIAMSNSGEVWEYKFEANKEIPTVRFPPSDELYNSAQTPLKLEASLALGVYFNAALKVTTDPGQLLPTAGAFLKFHGGMEVMCASVGIGSIFAKGSVDVKIACDTKVGPSLTLDFAFGVSIVVSLPVVGHASVTYLMGISMSADKEKVIIVAMMSFKGNAELAGGLVSVTIYIEAKGIVKRIGNKTDASAQVTFALDVSVAFIINISFSKTWGEDRQIA